MLGSPSLRATVNYEYCKKFTQLNLLKIQTRYTVKGKLLFFRYQEVSGLDEKVWIKIMENMIAEMNAHKN